MRIILPPEVKAEREAEDEFNEKNGRIRDSTIYNLSITNNNRSNNFIIFYLSD